MYYVIQVPGKEEDNSINLIKNKIDESIIKDIFIIKRKMNRKFKNERKEILTNLFPGYVFIETDDPYKLYVQLYDVPAFTKLLGKAKDVNMFQPVTEEEARVIDILASKETNRIIELANVEVLEGKKIRIIDGQLYGLEGMVSKVDLHKRVVYVDVKLLGEIRTIQVGINIVRRVDD